MERGAAGCTPGPGTLGGSITQAVCQSGCLAPGAEGSLILIGGNSAILKENTCPIKVGLRRSGFSQVEQQRKAVRSGGLDTVMKVAIEKGFFLEVR